MTCSSHGLALGLIKFRCLPTDPGARPTLACSCGRLAASPYFAALDKANGRIDDNLVALFDPLAYFYVRAQIARHRHLPDTRRAVLDHGDLQAIAVENDCIRRHQEA